MKIHQQCARKDGKLGLTLGLSEAKSKYLLPVLLGFLCLPSIHKVFSLTKTQNVYIYTAAKGSDELLADLT